MARIAHRYNTLGQILAAGGEVGVGLLIARGASRADVTAEIQQRFPDLPVNDVAALYDISFDIAQAGQNLTASDASRLFDLGLIPVNPSLFGSEPEGRRIQLVLNATNNNTGKSVLVYQDLADDTTLASVFDDAFERLAGWIAQYPKLAEYVGIDLELASMDFDVFLAQRRF